METKNRLAVIEKDDVGNKVTMKLSCSGNYYSPQASLQLECKEAGAKESKLIAFHINKGDASMLVAMLKSEFAL